ncbi:MAG: aspartate-semialdehyde dehydrogenase, partial [Planctomycetes bacterium]|nr:aspartate-semialdehyde dehydrogenase [Planctomycetota bacterium]
MTRPPADDRRIPVAVLGATGFVGQVMLRLLRDHPWFRVDALMASDRSAGRPYGEACAWAQTEALEPRLAAMTVRPLEPGGDWPIVLSALPTAAAHEHERAFARAGHLVVSNASAHRLDADVPLLVPEVNAGHLELARAQPGKGRLLTNPNCTTVGLVLALAPLAAAFGVRAVSVVSLQALSGAGLPGPPAMLALDNVLPHIAGEEDKLLHETNR